MKVTNKRLKPIAFFLSALLLFQSCVVCQKTPTTLEQASREQTRTKVTTEENKTYKFNYITYDNGVFYGINKRNGKPVKTSLYSEVVTGVYEQNDAASTLATVATIIGIPVLLIGIVYIAYVEGW